MRKIIMNKLMRAVVTPIKDIQFCEDRGNLNFIFSPFCDWQKCLYWRNQKLLNRIRK